MIYYHNKLQNFLSFFQTISSITLIVKVSLRPTTTIEPRVAERTYIVHGLLRLVYIVIGMYTVDRCKHFETLRFLVYGVWYVWLLLLIIVIFLLDLQYKTTKEVDCGNEFTKRVGHTLRHYGRNVRELY